LWDKRSGLSALTLPTRAALARARAQALVGRVTANAVSGGVG